MLSDKNIIFYTLNDLRDKYKKLTVIIRAQDSSILFEKSKR